MTNIRKVAAVLLIAIACTPASAIAVGNCDQNPCADDPTMNKQNRTEPFTAVPVDNFTVLATDKWIEVPGGTWRPTKKLRDKIGYYLPQFVAPQARSQKAKLHKWTKYTFQFQGQSKDNRQLVFVNAFCIPPPKDARREFVEVDDGGACFFQLYFDAERGHFLHLSFNGVG